MSDHAGWVIGTLVATFSAEALIAIGVGLLWRRGTIGRWALGLGALAERFREDES